MNIVKIHGGLGNQMFQFAFGKYIEYVTNKTISFDLSWFDNCCSDRPYLLPIAFDLNINQRLSRISSSKHLKYLCKYIHPKQARYAFLVQSLMIHRNKEVHQKNNHSLDGIGSSKTSEV